MTNPRITADMPSPDAVDETTLLLRAMGARLCALLPAEPHFIMPGPGFVVTVTRSEAHMPDPAQLHLFPTASHATH